MRRAFDLTCAGIAIVLLLPLFFLIALAIKLEDGGSVFYSQWRVGKDFRRFRLLKFRSMIPDADQLAPLTARSDGRITRVGAVLRRHKLDELPQLINVVKGDMQLAGARPELEQYVEMFRPQYAVLLRDRPGITDLTTLAYRNEQQLMPDHDVERYYVTQILPRKLELSVDYSRRRTFLSDLGVVIRTVFSRGPASAGSHTALSAAEPDGRDVGRECNSLSSMKP